MIECMSISECGYLCKQYNRRKKKKIHRVEVEIERIAVGVTTQDKRYPSMHGLCAAVPNILYTQKKNE